MKGILVIKDNKSLLSQIMRDADRTAAQLQCITYMKQERVCSQTQLCQLRCFNNYN